MYWNVLRDRAAPRVNHAWYAELGERWYEAQDTPIALLRAESRHRNPWIAEHIGPAPRVVLDLGCGAGFLSNGLAARGIASPASTPRSRASRSRGRVITRRA